MLSLFCGQGTINVPCWRPDGGAVAFARDAGDGAVARAFGCAWYTEARSAILIVPSVVARMERNLLFNAAHPDFPRISAGLEEPIRWDERLFES